MTGMKTTLRTPCDKCPFRRDSLRGWLGPWDVEGLLWHLGRGTFACHKTIVRDDQPEDELTSCAGAAIFLNNKHERSRHWKMAEHQDNVERVPRELRDQVFKWGDEFRAHHGIGMIRDEDKVRIILDIKRSGSSRQNGRRR
jgi:hypothetical protein